MIIHQYRKLLTMEKLLDFLESILDTIKDNGLFIFLAILFPVLLYNLGAGKEIILDLVSQDQETDKIFFATISFIFLGLSIWCVPTISIYLFKFLTKIPAEKIERLLDKLLDLYNAKPKSKIIKKNLQIPVRYLAIIPWVIFIFSLINVYYNKSLMIITGVILFLIIKMMDYYSYLLTKRLDATFLQFRRFWEILCLGGIVLVEYALIQFFYDTDPKFIITFSNILGVLLSYLFFLVKENSEDYPDGDRRKIKMIHRKTFYAHIIMLIVALITMISFFIKQNNGTLNHISPITIGTMIMSFYILIIEFFFTSQILLTNVMIKSFGESGSRFRLYKIIVVLAALGWIGLLFSSTNSHTIKKKYNVEAKNYVQRDNIENHFQKWYDERKDRADTLEVFLVSGQGGGSRAGYWFLSNMYELDSKLDNFYENLYSVSTVSGSSSGAQMYIASKKYYETTPMQAREISEKIYTKNYLSSALYGILIGDFLESLDIYSGKVEKDRNTHFQKEEMDAFIAAHKFAKSQKKNEKDNPIDFFSKDYMYYYKKDADSNKYETPLFFLNTTVVENGKKAVFSPVLLNTSIHTRSFKDCKDHVNKDNALFTLYEDAYGIFRNCDLTHYSDVPMSACVNASQSFPIINAYSYLHGVGRLADGGIFENSGTSTTMDVYMALKKYIEANPEKNIKAKFTMINILNGKIDYDKASNYQSASILNTATVMSKNPFTGHELMAIKQFHKNFVLMENNKSDRIVTLKPTREYTLSRILSKETIYQMRKDLDSVIKINKLFDKSCNLRDIQGISEISSIHLE